MSLEFNEFFKKYGVRQAQHLINPVVHSSKTFIAPKRTFYHCIPTDAFQIAPDLSALVFQNNDAPVYLHNVIDLASQVGKPRPKEFNAMVAVRNIFIGNKRFRRLLEVNSRDRNLQEIVAANYAILYKRYQYTRSVYRDYYEWYNINRTICAEVARLMPLTARNHFLFLSLDKVALPSRVTLDKAIMEDTVSTRTATLFKTPTNRWLLEFWKWLSDMPEKSMFTEISKADLTRVNFVITCGEKFIVINLGRLASWKKPTAAEIKANPKLAAAGFTASAFQRYFLFMLLKLQQAEKAMEDVGLPVQSLKAAKGSKPASPSPAVNQLASTNDKGETSAKKSLAGGTSIGSLLDTDDHSVAEDQLKDFDASVETDMSTMDELATEKESDAELPPEDDSDVQDMTGDDPDPDSGEALLESIDNTDHSTDADLSIVVTRKKSDMTPAEAIENACNAAATLGALTAPEYRALKEKANLYKKIKAPDGQGTIEDFMVIKPEHIQVKPVQLTKDRSTILDKSMLQSSLATFDKQYIKNVHHRNVVECIVAAQYGKVIVTGLEHEVIEDIAGEYDTFRVSLQPVDGAPSTINIKMAKLNEDGTFRANGVVYRMRKQQFDLPIRKVSPGRVALTSYYGKVFIDRCEKKASNYAAWIGNQVMAIALTPDNGLLSNIAGGVGFDKSVEAPLIYSSLGMRYVSMQYKNYLIYFSRYQVMKLFDKELLKKTEVNGTIVVGHDGAGNYLLIDKDSTWYTLVNGEVSPLGTIENMLGIDMRKAPVPYATIKVFGQDIPIGFCYAYLLGLDALMKILKVTPKRVNVGTRFTLEEHEFSVVFADETLIFDRENVYASLIFSGLNEYHKYIRMYRSHDFNKKAVYANIMDSVGLGVRYLRELVLMDDMFVDPITKRILEQMKEPTSFRGLLGRGVQLLCTDSHPDEIDTAYMRFRGYERFSGAVYSEMVKSMRVQRSKMVKASRVLEMNPYAVYRTIMTDAAVMPVKEINPIEFMKDTASVTFSGTGGRSGRTMVKHTRRYHENSMGVMSEATVDSGDVGVNVFLSMNPQLNTVMGTTDRYSKDTTGASSMLSISALNAPAADRDDPRRTGFVNIQNSHTVACDGYIQMPFRTGAEQVIPYQVGDLYATMAEEDGVVTAVNEKSVVVTYKSGATKAVEIGRRFGSAAGLTVPHQIVTPLKAGQPVKAGMAIAFNTGFFEEDMLNPGYLVFKFATLATVALFESPMTDEDSSCISYRLSKKLTSQMTKEKNVFVNFDQIVSAIPKIGEKLLSSDILCIIENESTAGKNYFQEASLDTLKMLNKDTPPAGIDGVLERIEIYYHGEIEDMSPSLKALVKESDRRIAKQRKEMGKSALTGAVDEGFRIEGTPLDLDSLVIRFFITTDVSAGVADKAVVANQIKTVVSETIDDDIVTESGTPVDMFFGRKSLGARIVTSPDLIGTSIMAQQLMGKAFVAAYRS